MKSNLANIITMLRLVGAIAMMSFGIDSDWFIIIYTFCGITDAVDGFVARKLHIESELGSKLDSISDLTFYSVMMYKIWPILKSILPKYLINIIWTIAGIRAACYLFVFVRDKKLASEHFILNKLTGFMLFAIPYIIYKQFFIYYAMAIILVAMIAALYEFYYHLTNKNDI